MAPKTYVCWPRLLGVILLGLLVGPAWGERVEWQVAAPPPAEIERLDLDAFYEKYVSVEGFPIVASARVSDAALLEAAYIVSRMLAPNPAAREAMIESGTRLAIMAHDELTTNIPEHSDLEPADFWDRRARGLGATRWRPAVSAGEENLLQFPGDPYVSESILVHEFAHAIHQMGLNNMDDAFQGRLETLYEQAMAQGLWEGTYAAENPYEYWAEGVQSWFDTNRKNDHEHNHVDTRELLEEYDPDLAALIAEVFDETDWRYRPIDQRLDLPHLRDFDPSTAPRFSWPEHLREPISRD